MDGVRPDRAGRIENPVHVEVALGRRRRTDTDSFIRHANMKRCAVDIGIHGNRRDLHFPASADDPDSDLPTVGDENLAEHACFVWGQKPCRL